MISGGANYDDYNTGDDSFLYNVKAVYKNIDPASGYQWQKHGELLKPRSRHNTVYLKGQFYHIAGYGKTYTDDGVSGKWLIILYIMHMSCTL